MLELLKQRGWIVDRWETDDEAVKRHHLGNLRRYWKVEPAKLPELIEYAKRWEDKAKGA
jgi:hypothetical protein